MGSSISSKNYEYTNQTLSANFDGGAIDTSHAFGGAVQVSWGSGLIGTVNLQIGVAKETVGARSVSNTPASEPLDWKTLSSASASGPADNAVFDLGTNLGANRVRVQFVHTSGSASFIVYVNLKG